VCHLFSFYPFYFGVDEIRVVGHNRANGHGTFIFMQDALFYHLLLHETGAILPYKDGDGTRRAFV
jgi:hypothetical protein